MDISISQQVTATYARNHFREITEKALKEGKCFIMRGSQPSTVVLSMEEYRKLVIKEEAWKNRNEPKVVKKITLEELRKNSVFAKYPGCMKDEYPGMTALDLQHNWYKYVD